MTPQRLAEMAKITHLGSSIGLCALHRREQFRSDSMAVRCQGLPETGEPCEGQDRPASKAALLTAVCDGQRPPLYLGA